MSVMAVLSSPHGSDVWLAERVLGVDAARIVDFSSNVNPYGPSPKAISAVINKLWMVSSYPDDEATKLKEKLAEHYGLRASNFVVGNGSTEIIYMFSLLFANKGIAGIHIPTFSEYERAVTAYGGTCIFTKPHIYDQPGVDEFLELMDRGAKALFICNPNNPNGAIINPKKIEEVLYEAEKRGAYVLLDEDFIEFADEGSVESFICEVERFENLVVLRSFTKSHGLAGLRIGYAAAHHKLVKRFEAIRTRWNVNLLAQEAAMAALDDVEHVEAARRLIRLEKPRLIYDIEKLEWLKPIYGHANFLLIEITRGPTSPSLKAKLALKGILIRDCSNFRGLNEKYIRIAVRKAWENAMLINELERLSDVS